MDALAHCDRKVHMGDCQNYGPFLRLYYNTGPNTGPNLGDPTRDHNYDNPPHRCSPGLHDHEAMRQFQEKCRWS